MSLLALRICSSSTALSLRIGGVGLALPPRCGKWQQRGDAQLMREARLSPKTICTGTPFH
jgi:hypothetical protein